MVLAEVLKYYSNAKDLRPTYQALKELRSMSASRVNAIRKANGCLVSDIGGQRTRWAGYFGQLLPAEPSSGNLGTDGLQAVEDNPSIDDGSLLLIRSE